MNFIDFFLLLLLITAAVRGAQLGLSRSFFSLTGFWLGLVFGAWIAPRPVRAVTDDPLSRLVLTLAVIFGLAILLGLAGHFAGHKLAELTRRIRLHHLDAVLGSAFSTTVVLVVIWLLASLMSGLPYRGLNRDIQDSRIIAGLLRELPPAPGVIARLPSFINPFNFPQVFIGPEPRFGPVDPATAADVKEALSNAALSTVRIESIGCGGLMVGSGFVVAPNLVVTNAHVVAGIDSPTIFDQNGRRGAVPVYFDPANDIAILRTGNLAGTPLEISPETADRGTSAVVLGYPGGGRLQAVPAGIVSQLNALGRDIYSQKPAVRSVYVLRAAVHSGNSGGPLVRPDGTVLGVIFARSEAYPNVSYAVTGPQVIRAVNHVTASPAGTGACLAR